jgi:hypothetical protein
MERVSRSISSAVGGRTASARLNAELPAGAPSYLAGSPLLAAAVCEQRLRVEVLRHGLLSGCE